MPPRPPTENDARRRLKSVDSAAKCISEARNGCMDSLALVGCFLDSIPAPLQADALRLCCETMASVPVEAPAVNSDWTDLTFSSPERRALIFEQMKNGPICNAILSHCVQGISYAEPFTDATRVAILAEHWPKVTKWIQYYAFTTIDRLLEAQREDQDDPVYQQGQRQILMALARILLFASRIEKPFDGTTFGIRAQDDKTFEMLCVVWLCTIPYDGVQLPQRAGLMEAMGRFLEAARVSSERSLEEARLVLGRFEAMKRLGTVSKTVTVFLKIALSIHEKVLLSDVAESSLTVINLLICQTDRGRDVPNAFLVPLVKRDIAQTCLLILHRTGALQVPASGPIPGQSIAVLASLLKSPFAHILAPAILKKVLNHVMLITVGRPYIGVAQDPSNITRAKEFVASLNRLLHHYPVLSAAIEGMKSVTMAGTHATKQGRERREKWMEADWLCLEAISREAAAFKEIYDARLEEKDTQTCQNCGITDAVAKALFACSSCKVALYCSSECQKAAWSDKHHKIECSFLKLNPPDKYYNSHEFYFLPHLVSSHLYRYFPGVRRMIELKPDLQAAYNSGDIMYRMSFGIPSSTAGEGPNQCLVISAMKASSLPDNVEALESSHRRVDVELPSGTGTTTISLRIPKDAFECIAPSETEGSFPSSSLRTKATDVEGNELKSRMDDVDIILARAEKLDENAARDDPEPSQNTRVAIWVPAGVRQKMGNTHLHHIALAARELYKETKFKHSPNWTQVNNSEAS